MSSDRIITLELRQETANNILGNGDFTTVLQTPITIEEGDEIVISNSFLDTTTQSNTTVNLDSDINLQFEFFPWVNNIFPASNAVVESPALDGCKHIPCLKFSHPGGLVGFTLIEFLVVSYNEAEIFAQSWGNTTMFLQYTDIENKTRQLSVFIPASDTADGPGGGAMLQIGLGIVVKNDSFRYSVNNDPTAPEQEPFNVDYDLNTVVTQAQVDNARASFDSIQGIIVSNVTQSQSFSAVNFQKDITIKAGSYSPNDFAVEITTQMTRNLQAPTDKRNPYGVNNNLLQASFEFEKLVFVNAESSFVEPKTEVVSNGFQYKNDITQSVWVGTNQFDLSFDPTTNRYVLSDMHIPIYIAGNKSTIQFETGSKTIFQALAYSGICITNITASNILTGKVIPDFAFKVLGFNVGKLAPKIKYVEATVLNDEGSLVPNLEFISGENFTSAFNGIDLVVDKDIGGTATGDLDTFTKVTVSNQLVSIVGDSTEPILSENIFAGGAYTFGYYKIEINSTFKNLLIGNETIQRNIMAIVSKYFEDGSYTSGTDGIPYIHKGMPVILSSLGVRILNSDNEIPDTLGTDNSVFIRINKAIQPIVAK